MSRSKAFNQKERRRLSRQHGYGHRPVNDWGAGDLPAPWAAGDMIWLDLEKQYEPAFYSRLDQSVRGRTLWQGRRRNVSYTHGYFVVCTAFSVDYGDGWYFRVTHGDEMSSDRMHVFYPGRTHFDSSEEGCNFMAPFQLVETSDPEGLALREQMLADGWTMPEVND